MESEGSNTSSDLDFNDSNYSLVSNVLHFELSETNKKDMQYEGISKMSKLFCPSTGYEPAIGLVESKPDVDSIKMFVGQIPHTFTECDLLQMFEKFGKVYELRVLKDKITGRSKGCCFVTFFTRNAALNAQNALHNTKVLPGMHHPIQMKPADSENRNDRKLFVGMLPKKYSESDIRNLFSAYGTIEECTVLRDANKHSKGCAFVTYLTRQSAHNAVKSMHHCHIFEGCSSPMVVKFADTQKDKELRRMHLFHSELNDLNQVSNILQQISPETLTSLVASNKLIQQLQNSALTNTNLQYFLPNTHFPSEQTFNWCSVPTRLLNIYNKNNTMLNQVFAQDVSSMTVSDVITLNDFLAQLRGVVRQPQSTSESIFSCNCTPFGQVVGRQSWDKMVVNPKQIEGPDGANLFIYHLPHEFNDQKLGDLFNPYGKVISAKVFIDKITKLSKCFGFVSYDNVLSANVAIHNLNGFHILGKKLKVEVKKKKITTGI